MMKGLFNLAGWDRMGRMLIGIVLLIGFLSGGVTGLGGLALAALGAVLLATGALGFCPLYLPIRLNTRR